MAAWGAAAGGFRYRGHDVTRHGHAWVVLPYGVRRSTAAQARRWIDGHVAREAAGYGGGTPLGFAQGVASTGLVVVPADGYGALPTVSALRAATQAQIDKAAQNIGLTHVGAEYHVGAMVQRPVNNAGAWFRAAYWLAVAARPTALRLQTDLGLLAKARAALAQADAASEVQLFGTSTGAGRVDAILLDAERTLEAAHRPDVAAILNAQRGAAPASVGLLRTPSGRLAVAGGATAVVAAVALAVAATSAASVAAPVVAAASAAVKGA